MRKSTRDTDEKESSKPLPEEFPAKRGRPVGSGRRKVLHTCIILRTPALSVGTIIKHSGFWQIHLNMHAQNGAAAPAAQSEVGNASSSRKAKSATADKETSEVSAGSKPRRKRSRKVERSHRHLRQFLPSVVLDGETFCVGDSAYLILTDDFDEDDFAEEEVCQVCKSAEPDNVPILECNKCLLGYHLTCLRPPLAEVPKVSA